MGGLVGGAGGGGGGGVPPPPPPPHFKFFFGVKGGEGEGSLPQNHPTRRQGRRTLNPTP